MFMRLDKAGRSFIIYVKILPSVLIPITSIWRNILVHFIGDSG
jgi:hypothetical protein